MKKKEICAFLLGCQAEDFMAYADKGDEGAVVVGPDGRKYRFDAPYLEQAEPKAEAWLKKIKEKPEAPRSEAQAPKPKPKTKRRTKRQPTSKPTSKTKPGAKQ